MSNTYLKENMDDDVEPLFTYQVDSVRQTEPSVSLIPSHPHRVDNDTISEPTLSNAPEVADFDIQSANNDDEQSSGEISLEDHSRPLRF